MIVTKVIPSGYCKGVINAINIAKKTKEEHPNENVYVLGMIVHNTYVTNMLNKLGIITLDDTNNSKEELIDKLNEGVLILTAHGTSDKLKQKAISKGLQVVDAACSDVIKTKNIIIDYLNKGYDVIYFGIKNHPESAAILSLSDKIHLITSVNEIENLNINNSKIVVTNQTTMSYLELENMINAVLNKYNTAIIEKEICNATSSRQLAISNIKDADILYVVGDKKSNNTNKLVEIASKKIKRVYLINSKADINISDLNNNMKVYVSAGASTPPELIDDVINYLKNITF